MIFKSPKIVSLFSSLLLTVLGFAVLAQPTSNSPVCENQVLNLIANVNGTSYAWTGPNGFTSSQANPSLPGTLAANGTYNLEVIVGGNPQNFTLDVTINPRPEQPIVPNISTCVGEVLQVAPDNPDNSLVYTWTTPSGGTITGIPLTINTNGGNGSGTYSLVASNNNCDSQTENFSVTVYDPPGLATVNGTLTLCNGENLDLNASNTGGNSVTWINPDNSEVNGVNFFRGGISDGQAGTYGVKLSNPGCEGNVRNFTVSVMDAPTGFDISGDSLYCEGDQISLTATYNGSLNNADYTWSGPNGFNSANRTATRIASDGDNGTYQVSVVVNPNANNNLRCPSDPETIEIQVFSTPEDPVLSAEPGFLNGPGNDLLLFACENDPVVVRVDNLNGGNLEWITPNGLMTTDSLYFPGIALSDTGSYQVRLVNGGICESENATAFDIELTEIPVVEEFIYPETICDGDSVAFVPVADFDYNYTWTRNGNVISTADTMVVNPVVRDDLFGEVLVEVSFAGCVAPIDTLDVSVLRLIFNMPLNTPTDTICEHETLELGTFQSDSAFYTWTGPDGFYKLESNPDGFYHFFDSIRPEQEGMYSVVIRNACSVDTATTFITVKEVPDIRVSGDFGICDYEQTLLTVENLDRDSVSYLWSTGDTLETTLINEVGDYQLVTTNEFGCITRENIEIIFECDPVVYVPGAFTPNGDGLNDVFKLESHNVEEIEFWVYNRFGERIFSELGTSVSWDGDNHPSGTYYYRLVYNGFKDDELTKREISGFFTLIR